MNQSRKGNLKSARRILDNHIFLYNKYVDDIINVQRNTVVDQLMEDYDSTSVLVVNDKFYLGEDSIKKYYENFLYDDFCPLKKKVQIETLIVEGDLVHLKWDAKPAFDETAEIIYVHENKIKYQKISYK
ncbi:hypothetical protein ACFVYJ_04820 [Pontibacter sp. JAM-7]|uniref:hypothetical protein n=1 Tax=Pontibacter sp. JAM-7 TaxID=3366581 RepID=UPI003AF73960